MFNRAIPPVTKNLLIINGLFFIATLLFYNISQIGLQQYLGLYYWANPSFQPYQFLTSMFMHEGWSHILFNMFGVWMFGSAIESYWGPKRFLTYYMITGIGAGLLWILTIQFQIINITPDLPIETIRTIKNEGLDILLSNRNYSDPVWGEFNLDYHTLINSRVVGASGALFGLLLAFGMMFPNTPIYLMFIPIPIKAKYMVIGYGLMELYSGISNNPNDNIAHFAHLGGMLFGIILILYWKKKGSFYKPW